MDIDGSSGLSVTEFHELEFFNPSFFEPAGRVTRTLNCLARFTLSSHFIRHLHTDVDFYACVFVYLQEWYLVDVSLKAPYSDVITIMIKLRRDGLFYFLNLVFPCLVIFLVSFLGFFLPLESGERINFQTTIFLTLVIYLLMIADMMPRTPKYIPVLGMIMCLLS